MWDNLQGGCEDNMVMWQSDTRRNAKINVRVYSLLYLLRTN